MSSEQNSAKACQGFSLLEMLAVIVIIAIILMIAVPSLLSSAPFTEVRTSTSGIAALMQQARLKAANSQKPARAVVNCSKHAKPGDPPCTMRIDIAVFDTDGSFASWEQVNGSARELSAKVNVVGLSTSTQVSGNPDRIFWVVFFPSSLTASSHEPFEVQVRSDLNSAALWELSVNRLTGRVSSAKVDL